MSKLTFVAAVAAGLAAGCFEAPKPNCAFLCGTDSSCPGGYTCAADGWCKRADLPATFACETGLDAAVADAADPDAEVDAADIDAAEIDAAVDAAIDAPTDGPDVDAAVPVLEIITANPLDFGAQPQSTAGDRTVTVRNSGGAPTTALTVDVTGAGFALVAGATDQCTGATLPALGQCAFEARFTAGAVGPATGVAAVSASAGGSVSLNLTGTSAPMLSSSGPLAFGDVAAAATADLDATFTNAGTVATATLTAAITGDPRFTLQADGCTSATVMPAGTCTVTVRFTASSAGAATGTLAITGSPGGPVSVALSATGL